MSERSSAGVPYDLYHERAHQLLFAQGRQGWTDHLLVWDNICVATKFRALPDDSCAKLTDAAADVLRGRGVTQIEWDTHEGIPGVAISRMQYERLIEPELSDRDRGRLRFDAGAMRAAQDAAVHSMIAAPPAASDEALLQYRMRALLFGDGRAMWESYESFDGMRFERVVPLDYFTGGGVAVSETSLKVLANSLLQEACETTGLQLLLRGDAVVMSVPERVFERIQDRRASSGPARLIGNVIALGRAKSGPAADHPRP